MKYSAIPAPQGLYDPAFERDSCGVAAVADIKGRRSHKIVADGITALINLEHRGAAGADPAVGDGAGILFQVPESRSCGGRRLRAAGRVPDGSGPTAAPSRSALAFLPADEAERAKAKSIAPRSSREEGLELLGWRPVPTDPIGAGVGRMALDVMPAFEQLFLAAPAAPRTAPGRTASTWTGWSTRPASGSSTRPRPPDVDVYFPSLSSRTMVYKGMLTTEQLPAFFPDITRRARGERDRHRALPVLHQHLPGLAAGPPVPLHRAQRRDQHRARQPQPDARPRGAAGHRR